MTNYHDIKFTNNAYGTLSSAITSTDTQFTVTNGSKFPNVGTNNTYFLATILDTSNNQEIIKVTQHSVNGTFTVVRAQEGTTARAFAQGDRVELRITAGALTTLGDIDETLPSQTNQADKTLATDGNNVSWRTLQVTDFMNQDNNSTGFFSLPKGTTAQRPTEAETGYIRYNTDHFGGARPEFYGQNNKWMPLNSPILNKYVITASAGPSGDPSNSTGVFPSDSTNWTSGSLTLNQFELTPVNKATHNILSVICKPMSTSSVFLIEVKGNFYSDGDYAYLTIGRSTADSAAGTTTGTTVNVGALRAGVSGDTVTQTTAIAAWHLNAHVHQGAAATYDIPNTTDFVRYCIHFTKNGNSKVYLPHTGLASLTVTELDGTGTTKVSSNTGLEVSS